MKTITPHAPVCNGRWQRKRLCHWRLYMMESRIEARDLGQLWQLTGDKANRRNVMRLMQRRERDQLLKVLQHVGCNECRF